MKLVCFVVFSMFGSDPLATSMPAVIYLRSDLYVVSEIYLSNFSYVSVRD